MIRDKKTAILPVNRVICSSTPLQHPLIDHPSATEIDRGDNDQKGNGVEDEKAFVLGSIVRHSFGRRTRCRDQRNGDDHSKDMLNGPIAVVCHSARTELHRIADKIQDQSYRPLYVCNDQQNKAQRVVLFHERFSVHKAQQ